LTRFFLEKGTQCAQYVCKIINVGAIGSKVTRCIFLFFFQYIDPSNFQMACLAYSLIESHNFYGIGSARWKVTNALLSCKNKGCVHIDLTSLESLRVLSYA